MSKSYCDESIPYRLTDFVSLKSWGHGESFQWFEQEQQVCDGYLHFQNNPSTFPHAIKVEVGISRLTVYPTKIKQGEIYIFTFLYSFRHSLRTLAELRLRNTRLRKPVLLVASRTQVSPFRRGKMAKL